MGYGPGRDWGSWLKGQAGSGGWLCITFVAYTVRLGPRPLLFTGVYDFL